MRTVTMARPETIPQQGPTSELFRALHVDSDKRLKAFGDVSAGMLLFFREFMSTSFSKDRAEGFWPASATHCVLIRIKYAYESLRLGDYSLPVALRSLSHFASEDEVLFAPLTLFRVVSSTTERRGGKRIVVLTVVLHKLAQVLPFEALAAFL